MSTPLYPAANVTPFAALVLCRGSFAMPARFGTFIACGLASVSDEFSEFEFLTTREFKSCGVMDLLGITEYSCRLPGLGLWTLPAADRVGETNSLSPFFALCVLSSGLLVDAIAASKCWVCFFGLYSPLMCKCFSKMSSTDKLATSSAASWCSDLSMVRLVILLFLTGCPSRPIRG